MQVPQIKYPVGIQSFAELRRGGYVYVDKTKYIYQLVSTGKYYFLSRPRRFGKSLLLSTIQAYFEGKKELFDALDIANLESEWSEYPVINISFAGYNPQNLNLEALIDDTLSKLELKYGRVNDIADPSVRFRNIILSAHAKTGKNVVLLIDEYDAPMVSHFEDKGRSEEIRNLLKSVYANLKDCDEYIKFAMLTGVSRFSKMTIFSGLNNLNDISMLPQYSGICGISESELHRDFDEGINKLATSLEITKEKAFALLKDNYDGYHFAENSADIYNPFSLLLALNNLAIKPYWFASGTPTFLVKVLGRQTGLLSKLFSQKVRESAISDIDTYDASPVSLLFQTGYLTIKDYDTDRRAYTLGIPNKEVEEGLFTQLLTSRLNLPQVVLEGSIWDIRDAFEDGNPSAGFSIIKSIFAKIPANVTRNMPEIYYENNLFLLFSLIGLDARAEWWSSDGRIDMLLMTNKYIYVMELKLDGSAEEAIDQIESKKYGLQFEHDGRKIIKVGINYSKKTGNIDDIIVKSN